MHTDVLTCKQVREGARGRGVFFKRGRTRGTRREHLEECRVFFFVCVFLVFFSINILHNVISFLLLSSPLIPRHSARHLCVSKRLAACGIQKNVSQACLAGLWTPAVSAGPLALPPGVTRVGEIPLMCPLRPLMFPLRILLMCHP